MTVTEQTADSRPQTAKSASDRKSGALFAGSAQAIIGSFVAVSALMTNFPWLGGQALRYSSGALLLFGLAKLRGVVWPRYERFDIGMLLLLSMTGMVGFNLCILAALERADPGTVGAIVGCVPLVLAIVGPLLAGRRPSRRIIMAAGIVVLGAAIVEGIGSAQFSGVLFALGALAGEACFSLLAVPLLPRLGPLVLSASSAALAGLISLVLGLVISGTELLQRPTTKEGMALVYLTIVVTAGAFVAWYAGVARLGVEYAGLFAGLIPISALVTSWLVGSGDPSLLQLLGSLIVGAGVVIGLRQSPRTAVILEPLAPPL